MENTETSGGTRFSKGKPSMWWAMPRAGLRLIARVVTYGAQKYSPFDWADGQSYSTLMDCFDRHWDRVLADGIYARDEESGELHLAHAGWNLLCLLHFVAEGRFDLDDVTKWRGVVTGEEPHTVEQVRSINAGHMLGSLRDEEVDVNAILPDLRGRNEEDIEAWRDRVLDCAPGYVPCRNQQAEQAPYDFERSRL